MLTGAAAVLAWLSPAVAQGADGSGTVTSEDGLVVLVFGSTDVPDDLSITVRPPEELPTEFSSWPNRPPHIDIEPHELSFDAPVAISRRLPAELLGLDLASQPIPVGVLAIVGDDGAWSWVTDATFSVDVPEGWVELGGTIDHAGRVFAFVSGAMAIQLQTPLEGSVGSILQRDASLQISPASGATLTALEATTGDAAVAVPGGDLYVFGEPGVVHQFECVGPGQTDVETRYAIQAFGDDNPITASLGLAGADLTVGARAVATCTG
jgi:hypothetical protein